MLVLEKLAFALVELGEGQVQKEERVGLEIVFDAEVAAGKFEHELFVLRFVV